MAKWKLIDASVKKIVEASDGHEYGKRVLLLDKSCRLGYPVMTGRWWQTDMGGGGSNFTADCGNAVFPTHYQLLPVVRS